MSAYKRQKQGSANSGTWAKSRPPPIFVNKCYWNKVTPIHLHIVSDCFHATRSELRRFMPQIRPVELICSWPFTETLD